MKVDASMDAVMEKVWEGQRMNAAETAQLYQLPLELLGSLAHRRRELAKAEALSAYRQTTPHRLVSLELPISIVSPTNLLKVTKLFN